MRNFSRTFWRCSSKEKNHTVFSDDCSQVQELLTAAFDGEAKGEALEQARRHMSQCSHCAQSWAQWETTRIQLRAVPVPAVPSSLLTRILLACRLTSPNDAYMPFADSSSHTKLVQYLDALEDDSTSASLCQIMTPVAVPPDLHRKILQATTEAPSARSFSMMAFLRQRMPVAPASHSVVRWGMGLAVPAMTVWFVLAGQVDSPSSFNQDISNKNEERGVSASGNMAKVPTIVSTAKPALKPLVKQAVAAAKALPRMASAATTPKAMDATDDIPSLRTVAEIEAPRDFQRQEARAVSVVARPTSSTAALRRARPQVRPATNLIENKPSGYVLAASRKPISRLPLRTTPQISHPHVTSPPRLARISESDFDEAFIAVTTARDNRPAEFGQAFDEYRAALLSDSVEAEEETEEL